MVNRGQATAADVHSLISEVRRRIHAAFDVDLQTEVVLAQDRDSAPSAATD
ncbi:MAG: hypothetical protein AAF517_20430 [Planctomycetota bacterium]